MAAFEQALARTLQFEGGYVADPADAGGETCLGISRRYHPDWPGWVKLDAVPTVAKKRELAGSLLILKAAGDFYRAQFWPAAFFDLPSQELANHVFDCAVLNGVPGAVRLLQGALNLLNRGGTTWPDIEEDGRLGLATLNALAVALAGYNGPADVLRMFKALRAEYYVERLRARPINERFARGWLARALS